MSRYTTRSEVPFTSRLAHGSNQVRGMIFGELRKTLARRTRQCEDGATRREPAGHGSLVDASLAKPSPTSRA